MVFEPLEMEQLHPRPSSSTTRPAALSVSPNHDSVLDRLCVLVRLYMELHPVIASIAVFVLLTMAVSLAVAVLFPRHGPRRNRLHHDYSKIQYDYNFKASQLDHWCLFGDDSACDCEDFTDPVPRDGEHNWLEAHQRNRRLASSASSSGTAYDVVLLGDDTVELWTGQLLNAPVANPNGAAINRIWNETFTKKGGGAWEGLALGIKGDSSANLLWRLQHGEMPSTLKAKVWWILVGSEDLARGGCSEEATVLGVLRVAEEVHWYHPGDVVVLQGILPRSGQDGVLLPKSSALPSLFRRGSNNADTGVLWPSIERVNQQLMKFCEEHPHMVYFDASKLFLGSIGNEFYKSKSVEIVKDLMTTDFVHPSVQGMQVLAQRMDGELNRIIYQEDEANDIEQRRASIRRSRG